MQLWFSSRTTEDNERIKQFDKITTFTAAVATGKLQDGQILRVLALRVLLSTHGTRSAPEKLPSVQKSTHAHFAQIVAFTYIIYTHIIHLRVVALRNEPRSKQSLQPSPSLISVSESSVRSFSAAEPASRDPWWAGPASRPRSTSPGDR